MDRESRWAEHPETRSYRSYSDLLLDVSTTYEVDVERALALLSEFGPQFGANLGHVYLFRASLTNRLGRAPGALNLLEEARNVGIRFPEKVLRGSRGLATLAGVQAFESLIQAFDSEYAKAQAKTRATVEIHAPQGPAPTRGWPLVVALHGNNGTPALEREQWRPLTDHGWLLALPGSSQPAWTPGYLVWDDRDRARRDVVDAIAKVNHQTEIDYARLVLAGFSAGGLRAIDIALDGEVRACGVITIAAFLTDNLLSSMPIAAENAGHLRVVMIVGERDSSAAGHRTLADRLVAAGATCVVDVRTGLGHSYPEDMHGTLTTAMRMLGC